MTINKCSVDSCSRFENRKGMCGMHYARMWRNGTLETQRRSQYQALHDVREMQTEIYEGKEYAVIELTKEYKTLIDIVDFPRISKFNWFANVNPYQVRGARHLGRKMVYIQHEIMQTTPWETVAKGLILDHKDGFTLHNWKDNLQFITQLQNMQKSDTSINRVGVSFHKPSGLFIAYLSYPFDTRVSLGYWRTREKAVEVEAMARLHQERFLNPEDFKAFWKTIRPREPRESEKI